MANELAPSNNQPAPAATSAAASSGSQPLQIDMSNIQGLLLNNRRLLLLIASVLLLAGFIGLIFWSAEAPYRTLFSNMDEKEAASVVEMLQKEKVPYRLEGTGTIMVPSDQVYTLRLKLAGEDMLPGNKAGYELFDKGDQFGISDFVQKVNLQRALQGELARTIEILPQVSAARVHLVLPKESAFVSRKQQATASVMLQLTGASRISKQSILAIQNLVSAGVPELDRENVTVVDSAGNLLTTQGESNTGGAGQTQQEYQVNFERRMEERLTRMLEQIVGSGQAVVRVSAEINREHVEQNNQRFNPDESVLRSERIIDESRKASDRRAMGIPGVSSNNPDKQAASQGLVQEPTEEAGRSEHVSNFEISSTTEKRIIPFGEVEKLSVAVVVGGTVSKQGETSSFTPRSQEELKSIRGLVERAMGYDEDRGDSLEVQSLSLVDMSINADTEALQEAESKAFYLELARYGLAGVALFLLVWFVLRPMTRRSAGQERSSGKGSARSDSAQDDPDFPALTNSRSDAVAAALSSIKMPALGTLQGDNLALQTATKEIIAQDPKLSARIIQQWARET